ncbi:MAG TPA: 16S rRNA (adenine(1518)-N(6)/adenine(1519)-N(6))-dimethyltransferase RsmA [Polyangia bacterium]|nr:16S rRNA (adenine(1518)-N(6)/adenine(1519)-N(6))-dimethyltransferase RsmA [Polyangia bacterium]
MPLEARALLKKYSLFAKKSWGQNFLVDERSFRAIVDACAIEAGDQVIEIGAGLGTLTDRLAAHAARVIAVERDRDMAAILRAELGENPRVEIAEANALTFDYAEVADRIGRKPIVCGNLPYQIASPILFRLLDARAKIRRVVIMLQREMADRIVAAPSTPEYGALSVMVAMSGRAKLIARVPAGAFVPAPRVASAVLRIEPFEGGAPRAPVPDEPLFSKVVHAAFNQRRKTLRNALRAAFDDWDDATFARAEIDPQRRGETLSVEEFAALTRAIAAIAGATPRA